jgi:glycosyltransferase involved in cell wall biosynthesis
MVKLSLLICTLENRKDFLAKLMACIDKQKTDEVEVLFSLDNGDKTTGQKRNELLEQAQGEYTAFLDDDDMISDDYVSLVLDAINKSNPDVIGMHLLMTVDGENEERTYHALKYDHWWDEPDPERPGRTRYFRNPNHLNPVKKELALKTKFIDTDWGEDLEYSKGLLQYLKTEEYIESPIYYYLCRSNK